MLDVCAERGSIVRDNVRVLTVAAIPCFLYNVVSLFPKTLQKVKRSTIPVVLSIVNAIKAEVL